jgi:alpha-D-ribose 1-methylphosphonate 5-phosphate C-P lyase
MRLVDSLLQKSVDASTGRGELLDESSKRDIRRAILTAVAIPGYQVPFGSREMPVARGWGSGGLQVTLALVDSNDTVKVYDQGEDAGVNAVNLRRMIVNSTGAAETTDARLASIVQTRHRVPEDPLSGDQILVLQVPVPEPLRGVERDINELARMHAENDYSALWVSLYEDLVRNGVITKTTGYPCLVDGRYVIATTPIPRWDCPKFDQSDFLSIFGAGREKRIYAIPPHTDVVPVTFDDVPFQVERTPGATCQNCGTSESFLVEVPRPGHGSFWVCSDIDWCERRSSEPDVHREHEQNEQNEQNEQGGHRKPSALAATAELVTEVVS